MQLMYEILPVFLFFFSFKWYGIYVATAVGIGCAVLQVVVARVFQGEWNKKQCIIAALFLVFGGLTIYFKNPLFIKWKPSIVFWLFAFALLISRFVVKTSWIASMTVSSAPELSDVPLRIWRRIECAWVAFFITVGGLNLWIAYHYSDEAWVNFKFYGVTGLLFVAVIAQAIYLSLQIKNHAKKVKHG